MNARIAWLAGLFVFSSHSAEINKTHRIYFDGDTLCECGTARNSAKYFSTLVNPTRPTFYCFTVPIPGSAIIAAMPLDKDADQDLSANLLCALLANEN